MENCNASLSSLLRNPPADLLHSLNLFSISTEDTAGSSSSSSSSTSSSSSSCGVNAAQSLQRPPLFLRCISRFDASSVSSAAGEQGEIASTIRAYIDRGGRGFYTGPLEKTTTHNAATVMESSPPASSVSSSTLLTNPQIVIVAEKLESPTDLEKLLRHELVHAVDAGIHHLDLAVSGPLACSEVRAAAAAECASYQVDDPSVWWHPLSDFLRRRCVKNNAVSSLQAVFPDIAGLAVDAVFAPCYSTPPHKNPLEEHPAFAAAVMKHAAQKLA